MKLEIENLKLGIEKAINEKDELAQQVAELEQKVRKFIRYVGGFVIEVSPKIFSIFNSTINWSKRVSRPRRKSKRSR